MIDCSAFYRNNTSAGRGKGNGASRQRVDGIQTVEDCRSECAKVHDCKFFIWNSPSSRRNKLSCWLKKNDKIVRKGTILHKRYIVTDNAQLTRSSKYLSYHPFYQHQNKNFISEILQVNMTRILIFQRNVLVHEMSIYFTVFKIFTASFFFIVFILFIFQQRKCKFGMS